MTTPDKLTVEEVEKMQTRPERGYDGLHLRLMREFTDIMRENEALKSQIEYLDVELLKRDTPRTEKGPGAQESWVGAIWEGTEDDPTKT